MTEAQSAAYIAAQTALFNCEMNGMLAENQHRTSNGESVAYGEEAFLELKKAFEPILGYNAILQLYKECIN